VTWILPGTARTPSPKLDAEQAVHAQEKEALLAEIEGLPTQRRTRNKDVETLKNVLHPLDELRRVYHPSCTTAFSERYRAALDKHYGQLKMEGDERRRMQFQDHVDRLKSGPDGKDSRIEK
jgi:hypothetical protein